MSEKILEIKYHCQHPSCQVFCKRGELVMPEAEFNELKAAIDGEDIFKSPRVICRMGFSQPFKALSVTELTEDAQEQDSEANLLDLAKTNPLAALVIEHREVTRLLDRFENDVRKRDIDAMWITSRLLENEIMLHSIHKEEEILFPLIAKQAPQSSAAMNVILEDHKEFLSLLHSCRCALQHGDILDGIISSIITNLRSHIIKEDEEFFPMIDQELSEENKASVLAAMKAKAASFEPQGPGDIKEFFESPFLNNRKEFEFESLSIKRAGTDDCWSCH